jgi:hypothetical protein
MKNPRFITVGMALTQRFASDEKGASMMAFGLSLIPIVLALQIGVEYQRMSRAQSALTAAADSAALTAAKVGMQYLVARNSSWNSLGVAAGQQAFQANVATIREIAAAPTPTIVLTNSSGYNVQASVSYTAQMHSLMTVSGLNDRAISNTVVATTAQQFASGVPTPSQLPYFNIDLVMDVSPSMAIGANTADMNNMLTATAGQNSGKCAFACHDVESGDTQDNYTVIKNWSAANDTPITLRVDVMKAAAQDLVTYVQSEQGKLANFTMGLYSMSYTLKNLLTPADNATPITLTSVTASNTSNFTTYNTAVGNVDFDKLSTYINNLTSVSNISITLSNAPQSGMVYYPGLVTDIGSAGWPIHNLYSSAISQGVAVEHIGVSDFATSLAQLTNLEGVSGKGATSASTQKVVILITDGLFDIETEYSTKASLPSPTYTYDTNPTANFSPTTTNPLGWNSWAKFTAPLSSSLCQTLKNNAVLVGVVYVTYVPNVGETNYDAVVEYNAPQDALQSNLQACASPGMYYNASNLTNLQADIAAGLQTIVQNAMVPGVVHLIQ